MAYFELNHKGCLHFEDSSAHHDVVTLGRMANASLTCLESNLPVSAEDKAKFAAFSIAIIYDEEKDKLSDKAKTLYYLDVEGLQKEHSR